MILYLVVAGQAAWFGRALIGGGNGCVGWQYWQRGSVWHGLSSTGGPADMPDAAAPVDGGKLLLAPTWPQ